MTARTHVLPRPTVAPATDELAARRQRRDRALRRDGAIALVAALVLVLIWPVRQIANPDLPLAQELTAQMDATFRAVRAGELDLPTSPAEVAPGIRGLLLERPFGDRWVLAGEAGSDCYAMWWDAEGLRRARTVPSGRACEPASELTSSLRDSFDRAGRAVAEADAASPWELVLPAPFVLRRWFLPAVIVAAAIGLSALVRMSIALLTGDTPAATRR